MKRLLTAPREPVNALTHWGGALAALIVLGPLLSWAHARGLVLWPFVVFSVSMVALYAASASYHSFRPTERGLLWLRKLDHAGIFLLIAGSYTPIAYYGLDGVWRDAVLWIVWGIALSGIVLKLVTMRLPRWISTALYLGMGWLALLFMPKFVQTLSPGALFWLAAGGVLYSIGAVIYGTKRWNPRPGVFGFHEIWHLFVLAGTGAHVAMMFHLG
ncbi:MULTISPECIES: PAQR family membrane homeostasis protein TrhA [unclassified Deinococcus]|uniref:PAQR family membrane homeostasis protein TrhA n=1 Tax=unclassified Deinococcus TaxID=2623546 RepID=UPI001C3065F8|nr:MULTISPECIES: hemolysin III family protein [unclassified Deinococcus]MDK2010923.1 hemolysin III family protein [Deinococcus sp. 43]